MEGDIVSVWVSSSSVVTEGVVSDGGAGAASSAKTRVGFGALDSQGNMGLGRPDAGGVVGTW